MAFIVEDGSGLDTANAYVAIVFVDTYHTDRGNDGWTGTDTVKEQAIVRATDYIDKRFGRRFVGFRQLKEQGLEWPRLDSFDLDGFLMSGVDEVPRQIQKACAEYALRSLSLNPLAPDPQLNFQDRDTTAAGSIQAGSGGGQITSSSEKVGPIETSKQFSTSFDNNTSSGSSQVSGVFTPTFPEADLWIEELLQSSSSRSVSRG